MSGPRRKSRRGRGGGGGKPQQSQHSSQPTSRVAYAETKRWLLERHGPVCSYCGLTYDARKMTLDHATPRRGKTAYDRRDNLVLACIPCNKLKADKAFLAFLLARPARAANLLRYGEHLSPMLLDLARAIAGPEAVALAAKLADPDYPYRD